MKTAVLLLAYGGPDSLDDVPAYLLDIRGGRETPQELVDEISHRYAAIGGRSPLLEITRNMVGGPITWSPVLQGGLLLSTRGGDFELTLGQDLSLGYAGHSRDQVELYLTESVTFRVIEPAAAVVFSGA